MAETEVPAEVRAIANFWGGTDAPVTELEDGVWHFACRDPEDGMRYRVWRPGVRYPVYEDSGRPCGYSESDGWTIRCLTDAPDAFWHVGAHGLYSGYNEEFIVPGWPALTGLTGFCAVTYDGTLMVGPWPTAKEAHDAIADGWDGRPASEFHVMSERDASETYLQPRREDDR